MLSRKTLISVLLLAIVIMSWGNSLKIHAKAHLAKFLIAKAWNHSLQDGETHKPWRWADTWPVAKLYFPKQRLTLYALAGAQGASLAFGPGHVDGTALPTELGTKVFGGHRDTHFAFLEHIDLGDIFLLQGIDGRWRYYRFNETHIADVRKGNWTFDESENEVHFITCYPFDAIEPGGPLRFIVTARPVFQNVAPKNQPQRFPEESQQTPSALIAGAKF